MNHLVLTVHGIRTHAHWQKQLSELLAQHNFQPHAIDFGYFPLVKFLFTGLRRAKVEWFCDEYTHACEQYKSYLDKEGWKAYPSIVAHSFGTYLVAEAMLKYPHIKFNKVILAASILPTDFPWEDILLRGQFEALRHEYGGKDTWTSATRFLAHDVGTGGATGYGGTQGHRFLEIRRNLFKHSDFFHDGYMEAEWIPFLKDEANYQVIQGGDVKSAEEFRRIAVQTSKIDSLVYGHLPGYAETETTMEQAESWFDTEPNIYTFLFDRAINRCIGYVNTLPVPKDTFENILARGIDDNKINEIGTFYGDEVYLYAISIAIDPRVKLPGVTPIQVELLLHGLFGKLEYLAEHRRARVRSVAAVGWTPAGNRICADILGMRKVGQDSAGHPVYRLDLDEQLLNRTFRPLRHVYRSYMSFGLIGNR
jgi:pimeloyl-ACP methyl ester carboxylesterase